MDFSDIYRVCQERLTNNWVDTPIAFENAPFEVPRGTPWIRAQLNPVLTENAALGGLAKRDYASFWIQIFTPLNEGYGQAYDYAAKLSKMFSNITVGGVTFYAAETFRIGDDGSGWFQVQIRAQCWAQSNCI